MNKDDIDFILQTETYRSLSMLFIWLSFISLIAHEFEIVSSLINWQPSSTFVIVFAILSVALRAIAIDRFLRINNQQNYNKNNPDID